MATPLEIKTNPLFGDLRPFDPWIPRFCCECSIRTCADRINRPHADGYVSRTGPEVAGTVEPPAPHQESG